jgi:hypothetical protein
MYFAFLTARTMQSTLFWRAPEGFEEHNAFVFRVEGRAKQEANRRRLKFWLKMEMLCSSETLGSPNYMMLQARRQYSSVIVTSYLVSLSLTRFKRLKAENYGPATVLLLGRCSARVSVDILNLTEVCPAFPQFFQVNVEIQNRLGQSNFIPNNFQFIIQLSLHYLILCNLSFWEHPKVQHK